MNVNKPSYRIAIDAMADQTALSLLDMVTDSSHVELYLIDSISKSLTLRLF